MNIDTARLPIEKITASGLQTDTLLNLHAFEHALADSANADLGGDVSGTNGVGRHISTACQRGHISASRVLAA
jgi:hypothetical protein